jgi:hypothetical protein
MLPYGALDAEPLNEVADPGGAGVTVNDAVGAWSGVMATLYGLMPTLMALPAVLAGIVIGVTVFALLLST